MHSVLNHILIVDDDPTHLNMLETVLADWGYTISSAVDGESAVAACHEMPFSGVLMDVRMPRKSGLEALEEIKAYNPAIPILIMTAHSNVEAAVTAIKAGAYDYLTKPLDFDKLQVSLKNMLGYSDLLKQNSVLQESLAHQQDSTILGTSEAMRHLLGMIKTVAASDITVLITGESGTGKELVAKAVHTHSERRAAPYVAVNCAALTETLLESELFGHEKGAFTGADRRREGRFVLADKGSIFLDEIGEMPLLMQAKLLRVIQERELQRVGGEKTIQVDVRIITATNRDLAEEVAAGRFREDLYYRLNVVNLILPPLRERQEDIPLLANHFANEFAKKNAKQIKGFTPACMDALLHYAWPGNVRELENIIERASVLLMGEYISERELPPHLFVKRTENGGGQSFQVSGQHLGRAGAADSALGVQSLEDVERAAILDALESSKGNKSQAAKLLGITRKTLYTKLQRYGFE